MLCAMKQMPTSVDRAIAAVLRRQGGLITRSQALAAGCTTEAIRHRIRVGGPWSVVLPGIYLNSNGSPTDAQREIAAVLYAGPDCVITGLAALRHYAMRVPLSEYVDVLVPDATKRQTAAFVRMHRTTRLPDEPLLRAGIRWAPAARAVADAGRIQPDFGAVRALVAEAVQHRVCTLGQLTEELRAGPGRGSAKLPAALEEVADGVASGAEGDLRKLIKGGNLPEPLYNPRLYVGAEFLAQPDAWWPDAGVAGEVDSREWHLSPADWARTMERHARMSAQGIIVLHFTPSRIRSDASRVIAELRSAIETGSRRPALAIRTVPHG